MEQKQNAICITSTVQLLVKLKDIVTSHIMNFVEIQKLWLNIATQAVKYKHTLL